MRLDARAFGLACGAVTGIAGFAATLLSLQRGAGQTISVISAVYFGYSWSYGGALLALVWGLVYGFVGGWLFATVYNGLAGRRGG
ncbi:MAG: hypothetical protein JSU87_11255 [Gemmatimonadota bacterium]|nr:MAG: hypothetical protein JSU87_11255 [Gemmatimonadota bacterium]